MRRPAVGPGPLTDSDRAELRAWADAQIAANDKAAAEAPTPAQRRAASAKKASHQKTVESRRRRADPKFRAKENLAFRARDTALRRLAAAFPDDFYRILADERIKRGLPPDVQRRNRRTKTEAALPEPEPVVEVPKPPEPRFVERQAGADPKTCKHNQGLKKFPYGKFCLVCGVAIK